MNITVVGGGNIGTLIAAQLSKKNNITMYTTKCDKWSNTILVHDEDNETDTYYTIDKITSSPEIAVSNADLIFFTIPAAGIKQVIKDLEQYIKPKTLICFYPGTGGVEYCCENLLDKGCIIFGTQRVCSVARLTEYGHSVKTSGKRKEMYLGTLHSNKGEYLVNLFEELFDIATYLLPNFLSVTFTPSNPILHTSRLYTIFKEYDGSSGYISLPLFYEEWDDQSSISLINCDHELQNMCNTISGLDLKGVKSLLTHYESSNYKELTAKITSIKSFRGLQTPFIKKGAFLIPDLSSRYFTADFPYGLIIIKAFSLIVKVETPTIDSIIKWYQKLVRKEYIDFFNNTIGKDSSELNLPQHSSLYTIDDIVRFYSNM